MKGLIYCFFLASFFCLPAGCGGSTEQELITIYSELRKGYGEGDTLRAKQLVQKMVAAVPESNPDPQQVRHLNNGLLQLMYTYYYSSGNKSGFRYFARLADGPDRPFVTPEQCRRKMLISTAYLAMQSGDVTKAVEYLERGLQLPEYPTPDERYADFTFAGSIYSQTTGYVGQSIEMYEKALAEVRQSKEQSGLPWVLGNLAELYYYDGRMEEAVRMHYESLEYFKKTNDDEGASSEYFSLAQLFRQLNMKVEARDYVDKGVELALRLPSPYNLGQLFTERYAQALKAEQIDSARYWLERADSCFVAADGCPMDHKYAQAYLAQLMLRDSSRMEEAIRCMEEIRADSVIRESIFYGPISADVGLGYLRMGMVEKGVSLLEQMLSCLEDDKRDVQLLDIYDNLTAYYRKRGDQSQALLYYDKWKALQEEMFRNTAAYEVAASRIRHETAQKELENERLRQKTTLQKRRLVYTWILSGLLVGLLSYIGIHLRKRQKYHRRVSEARLAQVSLLLNAQKEMDESRIKLKQQNEQMEQELQTLHRNEEENTLREGVKSIISQNEEANFRRLFMECYPHYLPTLRSRYPELTRMDELIAMLLRLNQSNDEIALTLNITKASVNKARSRMRKRLGLVETGVVLEDFLRGMV